DGCAWAARSGSSRASTRLVDGSVSYSRVRADPRRPPRRRDVTTLESAASVAAVGSVGPLILPRMLARRAPELVDEFVVTRPGLARDPGVPDLPAEEREPHLEPAERRQAVDPRDVGVAPDRDPHHLAADGRVHGSEIEVARPRALEGAQPALEVAGPHVRGVD